jgi:polyferredoxin
LKPATLHLLRRTSQLLFLLIFVVSLAFANRSIWFLELSKSFYRLDILATLSASIAGRVLIGGGVLVLIIVLLTLVFGRVWCGWFCPFGTMLDGISPKKQGIIDKRLEKWRVLKYILAFIILFSALLGNQTLMFLDPITILSRTLTGTIFPALRFAIFQTEGFFYQFKFLWELLDSVHNHLLAPIMLSSETVFVQAIPIFLFFLMIVGLNWIAERFWCRYLCPLGGVLGLLSKIPIFRRKVNQNCITCYKCAAVCPTKTIHADENFRSDPAECTMCFECSAVCPKEAISFPSVIPWKPGGKEEYDLGRRQVLLSAGLAVIVTAMAGIESFRIVKPANLIRPPGAAEDKFESLCIRCGECIRVCPTNGLQPNLLDAGWHNLMTPGLIPRLGACNYNCNACGLACPSQAIPALALEEKQLQVIGLARVDRNRCLPWAYQTPCIICEEACPLPKKAIQLAEETEIGAQGEQIYIQKPSVVKDLCIGCGICEHQCPQGGEAAIRVFNTSEKLF